MQLITVLNLMAAALAATPSAPDPVWVERETILMGTRLHILVAAEDRRTGLELIESGFAEVSRLESILSTWTAESELGGLNRSEVGEPMRVSGDLMGLLAEVAEVWESTSGAFDPGIGTLIDAWDLRGEGRLPARQELAAALASSGFGHFALDPAKGTVVRLDEGAWLDTGGFGKGAGLRAAAATLRAGGAIAARLNFGGQVLVFGRPPDGAEDWEIGIAHPERREEPAHWIGIGAGSISTTAQSERQVEVDGKRFGHVLDPRSGMPVPAWGSVTVLAEDALRADLLSTALFVMGPEEGMRWAAGRPEGVLFLTVEDGEVTAEWNRAWEEWGANNLDTVTGR